MSQASRGITHSVGETPSELRALLAAMSDVVLVLNREGRYLKVGATTSPKLVRPGQELVGRLMHEVLPAEKADLFLATIVRALDTKRTVHVEYDLLINGELVWFDGAVSPMPGDRVVWVGRDITVRHLEGLQIKAALREAELANQAKSDFMARASHELRTPLNSIIGFTAVLLRPTFEINGVARTYLERVHRNGTNLLRLVNSLLDLAKAESGEVTLELAPLDLREFANAILTELAGQVLDGRVVLVADWPAAMPPLVTDGARLHQVVVNLMANAIKYTPHGKVVLRILTDDDGAPTALQVQDSGIGIPADALSMVLEPFAQAAQAMPAPVSGTGLGLTIVQSLCEQLGYALVLESTVGVGTVCTVSFRR